MGTIEMVAPAISSSQRWACWPRNSWSPNGTVIRSVSLMMINGHRKLLQYEMKVNTASTANAGAEMGTMMLRRIRKCPAPSILAASSSSSGMVRKNCRNKKVPKAVNAQGRISA